MKKNVISTISADRFSQLLRSTLMIGLLLLTTVASAQSRRITLKLSQVPLAKVLQELQRQSGMSFVYNADEVAKVAPKSISVQAKTLEEILPTLLSNTGLTFEINDGHVLITRSKETSRTIPVREHSISGRVVDESGKPVIGATVLVNGTQNGTATDEKGNFTLNKVTVGQTLAVSYIGYESVTEKITSAKQLNIVLKATAVDVQDVVVTGMFTRKAESYTGSSATMTRKELLTKGNQNILQSIKNIDPSFNMLESASYGSDPNRTPTIEMRGSSSLPDLKGQYTQDPNQPLFILDGFETTLQKVLDLDMNRVQSVTLLKDAAAKAIYGSKAANGVVVIETVKLNSGEVRVNYTGNLSLEIPDLSSYNLCNASEKLELERQLGFYDGTNPQTDIAKKALYYQNLEAIQSGVNTDWLAQPTRVGVGNKHSLRVDVGEESLRAGFDFAYNDIQGVMKGSFRKTISGGCDVSYRWNKLQFRNLLQLSNTDSEDSPYGSFSDYASLNPYWKYEDENGNLLSQLGVGPEYARPVYNPLTDAFNNTRYGSNYFDLTNNTYLEYTFNDRWKLIGRFSFSKQTSGSEIFKPSSHSSFRDVLPTDTEAYMKRGSYQSTHGKQSAVSGDVNLQFNQTWGKHAIYANTLLNIEQNRAETYVYSAIGFPNSQLDNIIFAKQYAENSSPTGSESLNRSLGALLSVNYSYDNRYLCDVTLRSNGSSQFGSDKRWGVFWSTGLGWNVHNEKFMENIDFLKLKIRGSMGTTGSQAFNSSQSQLLYNYYLDRTYQGLTGVYLNGLANNELKWQQKLDTNIGFDAELFSRVKIRFDWYRATTKDFLTDINVPTSLGFSTYKANLGEIRNSGFEFNVSYTAWSNSESRSYLVFFVNGTHNKNKIHKISNSLRSMNADQDDLSKTSNVPLVRFEEGQSQNAIWAVRSNGIDPASGKEIFITRTGELTDVWNVNDKVVCGNTDDKIRGNFGFTFEHKGFSASVSCAYRYGGQIYNNTLISKVENAQMNGNVDKRAYFSTWKKAGDQVLFRNVGDWRNSTLATSRFVQDYNRIDISSISLGYDFYRFEFLKRLHIERMQLMVNINDLTSFSSVKIERGTTYPFARYGSCSLIVNF